MKQYYEKCPDCENGKEMVICQSGNREIECLRCKGMGFIKVEITRNAIAKEVIQNAINVAKNQKTLKNDGYLDMVTTSDKNFHFDEWRKNIEQAVGIIKENRMRIEGLEMQMRGCKNEKSI